MDPVAPKASLPQKSESLGAALTPEIRRVAREVAVEIVRARESGRIGDDFDIKKFTQRALASIPQRSELAEAIGDFYDTAGLVDWLDISKQALAKRVKKVQVLGCQTADGHWVYPAWQFTDAGEIVPGVIQAAQVLMRERDGWATAHWFSVPSPDLPNESLAIEWLTAGNDPAPVIAEPRRDTERLAS